MKPEDIVITDYMRILLGEVSWSFLIEIIIRVMVIFLILVVAMRILGKRMAARLSRTEMAAMVSLAAANGVPLLAPDRGILPLAIIAAVIIGVQKVIAWRAMKDTAFEGKIMDDMDILVKDGALQLNCMEQTRMSQEQVFARCCYEQIDNLGKVQRAYMEANGGFFHFKIKRKKARIIYIARLGR
ncbi:MAG: hypothetical protein AVDCRST_MAG95-1976 [uncultured Adhaeribacter sp.]|uniref:YetF C-terminal domain-containing protein n=1 Tax=uncultured Adhaeribacter sp. TaxID=448109 RepID=A0A6J4ILG0_9BACT|nr:MAG: hypothetical protein AVDCRST_MAG95-1976 [uncultured Adhaeribacter sp.]